jgi:hypothetical protein
LAAEKTTLPTPKATTKLILNRDELDGVRSGFLLSPESKLPTETMSDGPVLQWGREVIRLEAETLAQLEKRLDHRFILAVSYILSGRGRMVTSANRRDRHCISQLLARAPIRPNPNLVILQPSVFKSI